MKNFKEERETIFSITLQGGINGIDTSKINLVGSEPSLKVAIMVGLQRLSELTGQDMREMILEILKVYDETEEMTEEMKEMIVKGYRDLDEMFNLGKDFE